MFKNQRPGALRWSNILIIFILLLSISSAGGVIPASASELSRPPAKTLTTVYLQIHVLKEPVCVNKTSFISVRTIADKDIPLRGGKVDHISADPIDGVTVSASVQDPGIGTLSPAKRVSGSDPFEDPGEIIFSFEAKKAGTTTLTFQPIYKGKKGKMEQQQIKVVNCEYKVTMNVTDIDSRSGVTIWITGQLETTIKGESDALQGSGPVDMVSGFVGPPCTITYSDVQNPTTITGKVNDNDKLTLDFKYQPGTITNYVSCPDGGNGSASQVIDLTNIGIASADFPGTGGSRAFRFQYAGSDMAPGTMIIDVQPVEAGG